MKFICVLVLSETGSFLYFGMARKFIVCRQNDNLPSSSQNFCWATLHTPLSPYMARKQGKWHHAFLTCPTPKFWMGWDWGWVTGFRFLVFFEVEYNYTGHLFSNFQRKVCWFEHFELDTWGLSQHSFHRSITHPTMITYKVVLLILCMGEGFGDLGVQILSNVLLLTMQT